MARPSAAPVCAVLLAGGSGTRLWPESRRDRPKQFLELGEAAPLVAATWDRLEGLVDPGARLVVTRADLVAATRAVLPQAPIEAIVAEPQARGTAAAVLIGALRASARDPDAVVAVVPADHVIAPAAAFRAVLAECITAAADPSAPIVLMGIRPTHAATGFGYIQVASDGATTTPFRSVLAFHEKPDETRAWRYFLTPGKPYLWNAGIFVARARRFIDALATHVPGAAAARDLLAADPSDPELLVRAYAQIQSISFDHGVLERQPPGAVRVRPVDPAEMAWSDVGSWAALVPPHAPGPAGAVAATGDVIALDSRHSVVRAAPGQTIVTFGVADLVVVQAGDVTLVCPLERSQDLGRVLAELAQRGRHELL